MTREQQRKACEDARTQTMNAELAKLATWASRRPFGFLPAETICTILERKAADIRRAVDRAGMQAISDIDTETWP